MPCPGLGVIQKIRSQVTKNVQLKYLKKPHKNISKKARIDRVLRYFVEYLC